MIRFDKIKQTEDKTYFFFAGQYKMDLVWCLKVCGITDYEIVACGADHSYEGKLPNEVKIIPVHVGGTSQKPIPFPPVLISHLDTHGLEKAMMKIYEKKDEDVREHRRKVS